MFVSIWNTNNKGSQYLFSINSYDSMIELHDLNNSNNNKYNIWSFNEFFQLNESDYYWPYNYEIFELKKESSYIIAFIPMISINEDMQKTNFIKKFRFKSFDDSAYEELYSLTYENYLNQKILNVFLMDDINTIVVLTYLENDNSDDGRRRRNSKVMPPGDWIIKRKNQGNIDYYNFHFKFYGNNLIAKFKDMVMYDNFLSSYYNHENLFIKSIYLSNKFVVFLYYRENIDTFKFDLFELNYLKETDEAHILRETSYDTNRNNPFDIYKSLNDFIKINNNRLAFIYTFYKYISYSSPQGTNNIFQMTDVCILLIYINKYSYEMNVTDHFMDLGKYTPTMQISGFSYNGYLLLAANVMKKDDNCNYCFNKDFPDYFSMFMIFGYANGTDSIIDTSELFYNENPQATNIKLFWYLYNNLRIENNIFGYVPKKEIKLTFIPEEIKLKVLWHNDDGIDDKIKNILEEPLLRCYDSNVGELCRVGYDGTYEYIIEPNNDLIKNSQYY